MPEQRLLHYAERSITLDRERAYQQLDFECSKPVGFWVSVQGEQDWPAYCEDFDIFSRRLRYVHEVVLSETASIYYITTACEFDQLEARYGVRTDNVCRHPAHRHGANLLRLGELPLVLKIDWERMSVDYDGVIIAPYLWSRRMSAFWYYGWDCASGCIWNLSAIQSVELVTESEEVTECL